MLTSSCVGKKKKKKKKKGRIVVRTARRELVWRSLRAWAAPCAELSPLLGLWFWNKGLPPVDPEDVLGSYPAWSSLPSLMSFCIWLPLRLADVRGASSSRTGLALLGSRSPGGGRSGRGSGATGLVSSSILPFESVGCESLIVALGCVFLRGSAGALRCVRWGAS
jgi:hypothetical protein